MPSFDVVSEIDTHEATNAVDQANRELERRYDLKGANASFELKEGVITLLANEEFHTDQMKPILEACLIKRKIKVSCVEYADPQGAGKQVKVLATLKEGLDSIIKEIPKSRRTFLFTATMPGTRRSRVV